MNVAMETLKYNYLQYLKGIGGTDAKLFIYKIIINNNNNCVYDQTLFKHL